MKALRRFTKRLMASLPGGRDDDRVREELAEHVELATEEFVRAGMPLDEARRRARLTLGAPEAIAEGWRDEHRLRWLEEAWRDVRVAVRHARRMPLFTLAVVGSLVLGIGATISVYTVMRAALWRPIAGVVAPDRIVHLVRLDPDARPRREMSMSYVLFQELRDASGAAARVVAKRSAGRHKFGLVPESRERVMGEAVSDEFFAALGVVPAAGRVFAPGDDSTAGGARIAVLSHRFWTTRFQQDSSMVGQTIYYDETPFVVVGVAAERFVGVDAERPIDVWIPVTADPAIQPDWLRSPNYFWLTLLARLGPDTTAPAVEAAIDRQFRVHLETNVLPGIPARFRGSVENHHLQVRPAAAGLSTTGRQYESQLYVLMGLALAVLLICCANVANLVRARNEQRRPELALRRALGAHRGRLVRQLTTEGLLFAGIGAFGGLLLAPAASRWLTRLVPSRELALDLAPDVAVIAVATCLAVASALLTFLWPAWRAAAAPRDLASSRRASRRLSGGTVIVVSQVAIVMALLAVTGLSLTMLHRLNAVPLGFDATSVLDVALSFPKDNSEEQNAGAFERIRRALQESSTVESVTYAYPDVYDVGGWSMGVVPDGYVAAPGEDTGVGVLAVGPGFFQTLRVPVMQGRVFEPTDIGRETMGVVVNEAFVRRYFPDGVALGRAVRIPALPEPSVREIVGVVGDVRHYGVRSAAWPMMYEPGAQAGSHVLVRAREPHAALTLLQSTVSTATDAQLETTRPLSDAVAALVGQERILAHLSATVAATTLVLAALGLYGVVAFTVTCRRAEFGIRLALGAVPAQVRRLVLREAGLVVGAGVAIGFALSYVASRLFARLITDAPPLDVVTTLGAGVVLVVVAIVAAWVPAWKAGRTDPFTALRAE